MQRRIAVLFFLFSILAMLPGCGNAKQTIVQITDKITTLPAGQFYQFTANVEHSHGHGVTVSLTGGGTLVIDSQSQCAYYVAPPAPPSPNSVTVTVTVGSVSDSDTFTITAATGPVVSITPAAPTVSASSDTPVTLNIAVTADSSNDTLIPSIAGSSACSGGVCGSFGAVDGIAGSGAYTVQYFPPSSVTASTIQQITVTSTLTSSMNGTAFVTINP